MIYHIYSQPDLLAELRQELSPHVKFVPQNPKIPTAKPDRVSLDLEAVRQSCLLLRGTYFETMRLEVQGTSYKVVLNDFAITESDEDAAIAGRSEPQTYRIPKGQYVCIPHSLHQMDGKYFKNPKKFDPRRFFVTDDKNSSETSVEMGTMSVFGGGITMCKGESFHQLTNMTDLSQKGRNFAEREILAFTAAIISVWDIEPASGEWKHPGSKTASGAVNPIKDVRVRMKRRAA